MRAVLAVLLCLALAAPGLAQQRRTPAPAPAAEPPPVQEEVPPPYEPQLLRLAEIMGALAFLRDLCGHGDGSEWRARMAALLEAEAASEARKEKLAGAYNRGYRGFEITYRACTPAADLVMNRYLEEGARLTRDIARFGG